MVKRLAAIFFLACLMGSAVSANAQANVANLCPYKGHPTSLACLIPDVTLTGNSQNLGSFNTTIAQVLGQLPLAAPVSGFVLGFDKKLGIPVEESQNLGSVLTERGSTVGKNKIFLGFTAQRFVFHSIDGLSLKSLPTVFQLPSTGAYGANVNSVSANLNQYTTIVAYGISDRIDVSVTVPFERVSVAAGYTKYNNAFLQYDNTGVATNATVNAGSPPANFVAGAASGFGDILLNVKGTAYSGEKSKLAIGVEVRLPTGNEFNFLGSGALGLKPYVVFSRLGKLTPHANLGYQWNDYSDLYINPNACAAQKTCNGTLKLPGSIDYSAGIDYGIVKKLTVVADFVGQHYFNSPKLTSPIPAGGNIPGLPNCSTGSAPACSKPNGLAEFTTSPTVGVTTASVNVDNVALGLKLNPLGRLILSANALIRLDSGGLRPDRVVPLVGISYRF